MPIAPTALRLGIVLVLSLLCSACGDGRDRAAPPATAAASPAVVYGRVPADAFRAPRVREIRLPDIALVDAVWGAFGRDGQGRILVGVSAHGDGAAHLLAYDPRSDSVANLGSAVSALLAAGKGPPGVNQGKLHSRFVRGDDGRIYFSSFDEAGESQKHELLPRWGGHFWRLDARGRWEHLYAAPQGLIAVEAGGPMVYALGYWGHVLHAYRPQTGRHAAVRVGATGGHTSRNLLVDGRGYAYVPRIVRTPQGLVATLVTHDPDLRAVEEQAFAHYLPASGNVADNHGIVGLVRMADGAIVFTTHTGRLHRLQPRAAGPAALVDLGWLHPEGEAYAPGLFTFDGDRLVAGLARRARGGIEWVVRDLVSGAAGAFALDVAGYRNLLLYGSETRDDAGRFYVGGWTADGRGGQRPLLLQLAVD